MLFLFHVKPKSFHARPIVHRKEYCVIDLALVVVPGPRRYTKDVSLMPLQWLSFYDRESFVFEHMLEGGAVVPVVSDFCRGQATALANYRRERRTAIHRACGPDELRLLSSS